MKAFEDYFSEIQADMVSGCLEYAQENKFKGAVLDNIYIYCSCETNKGTSLAGDCSFRIDGKIIPKHKINGVEGGYVSGDQQGIVLDLLTKKINELRAVCKQFDKPMPTEMKLVYDVKNGGLEASYQYELIRSIGEGKTASQVSKEWFAQLAAEGQSKTKNAEEQKAKHETDWLEEINFLNKVEEKIPMNEGRTKLNYDEIEKIKNEHKNIPDDYLDYLKEIGWGSFRECRFMVFGKPSKLDDIGVGTDIDETGLIFFGDNFAGDFYGFNLKNSEKVIEWDHSLDEINETGKTFREFIRGMMGMGEDAQAQYKLAGQYYLGEGVEKSLEKAIEMWTKSANQGHSESQCNLACLYINGEGVPQDFKKAAEWYEKAAANDHAAAQLNLGLYYFNGQGVEKNYEKAVELWQKAAKNGGGIIKATACLNLGNRYYNGEGAEKSLEKAVEMWTQSANLGNPTAQNNLGDMYENGEGVPQDYKMALKWYKEAAKDEKHNDHKLHKGNLKELRAKLAKAGKHLENDEYFADYNFSDFWDDDDYSLKEYVEEPPSDELIKSIEKELGGYKLPESYIELMKMHNGGETAKTCFPTNEPTSWAEDHIAITGIKGIGRTKCYSLCGELGSNFMKEDWGYPDIGICIADCPSAGHDMIMLDYSECGKNGEPKVVHVDQEHDYKITFLANNFEAFVRGLIGKIKTFEDRFSEIQAEMVSGCLEYAEENKAKEAVLDNIYIYCSCETEERSTAIEGDWAYRINGKITERDEIDADNPADDDVIFERQDVVLHLLTEKIIELKAVCKQYDKPMPTEMKLVYNVKDGGLEASYQYELILGVGEGKTGGEAAGEWYAQLAKE